MNFPVTLPTICGLANTLLQAGSDPVLIKNIIIFNSHNSSVNFTLTYVNSIGSSFIMYDSNLSANSENYLDRLIVINPYDQLDSTCNHDNVVSVLLHTVTLT
jgi:hypothetical protein